MATIISLYNSSKKRILYQQDVIMIELEPIADKENIRFCLCCKINDTPCKLLFDTGSERSRISETKASHICSIKHCWCYGCAKRYVAGQMLMQNILIPRVKLYLDDETFNSNKLKEQKATSGLDGLLGIDIIQFLPFVIDYRFKEQPRAFLYPQIDTSKLSLLNIQYVHNRPCIVGAIPNYTDPILLDTGANHSFLDRVIPNTKIKTNPILVGTATSNNDISGNQIENIKARLTKNIETLISPFIMQGDAVFGTDAFQGLCLVHMNGYFYITDDKTIKFY